MKTVLKQMVQEFVNGKEEAAAVLLHDYVVLKSKSVTGIEEAVRAYSNIDERPIGQADRDELATAVKQSRAHNRNRKYAERSAARRENETAFDFKKRVDAAMDRRSGAKSADNGPRGIRARQDNQE